MKGFKVLDEGLYNQYGFQYELGKTYYLNGELKWAKNGFHFCKRPEDTLRYIEYPDSKIDMVEVIGEGDIVEYEDEYYDFYDMYASSIMTFLRIVPREEYIKNIIDSNNQFRVKRLIELLKLEKDEIYMIKDKYKNQLDFTINYYQNEEYLLSRRKKSL